MDITKGDQGVGVLSEWEKERAVAAEKCPADKGGSPAEEEKRRREEVET